MGTIGQVLCLLLILPLTILLSCAGEWLMARIVGDYTEEMYEQAEFGIKPGGGK